MNENAINRPWKSQPRFTDQQIFLETRQTTFQRRILLGILCVCFGGCGSQSKPSQPSTLSTTRETTAVNATANSDSSPAVTSDQGPPVAASVSSKDLLAGDQDTSAPSPTAGDPSNAVAEPATDNGGDAVGAGAPDAAILKSPQPTGEQLTHWSNPNFEPVQLLACRESSDAGIVSHLACVNDGNLFVTAGTKVMLWSVDAETPLHGFWQCGAEQSIKSLAVAPNGKWIAVGDSEGMMRMWSIAERQEVNAKQLYTNDIIQIAISPNGQELGTISYDDEITVWSVQKLEQKNRFRVDTDGLKQIAFLTDDLMVAAGQTTSIWNVRTGKIEKQLSPGRYNYTMARSADGKRFLYGEKESLSLNELMDSALKPLVSLTGGFAADEFAVFSEDGRQLATANGSAIRIWDLANGQLRQVIDAFGWPITGLNWLPKTNLLIVSSLNGRIRLWGTKADGQKIGLQPLQGEIAMLSSAAREPATAPQLMQMVDLRTFPRLPGGMPIVDSNFSLTYECAESVEDAKLFYRYQLARQGWNEMPPEAAMPQSIKFQKDGCAMSTAFYDGSKLKTMVMVNVAAIYDLRWIPKLQIDPIELVFENEDTVMYRTQANIVDIETSFLRILPDAGWIPYSRLNSAHAEEEESRHLTFLRGGMTLNVTIGRDPTDAKKFNVQYSREFSTKTIPVPPDAGYIEFDGSTQPMLVATTGMNLDNARAFYDQKMATEGWLVRDYGRNTKEKDRNWLSYIRGQQDLTVGLEQLENGRTRIAVGDDVQKSSWQFTNDKPAPGVDATTPGIEAVNFPVLNDSKVAKYDAIDKSIEISMDDTPLVKVGEVYQQKLLSMGWEQEGSGILEADYVFITFIRDKAEIALRARVADGKSIVNVQGDGILWNNPLPGKKRIISYETWLKTNHHPATLELLDRYRSEVR